MCSSDLTAHHVGGAVAGESSRVGDQQRDDEEHKKEDRTEKDQ